jgi:hypothetical protein
VDNKKHVGMTDGWDLMADIGVAALSSLFLADITWPEEGVVVFLLVIMCTCLR